MATNLTYQFGKSHLTIAFADIVTSDAQVIVSSDDAYLSMGGGVSAAIRRAGGDAIALDAAKLIPAPLGGVVVTSAGQLPASYIFHAITRSADQTARPEQIIRGATERCMQLVESLQVDSIAFPALGAGHAKFPLDQVAAEMARIVAATLTASLRPIEVKIFLHNDSRETDPSEFLPFIARFVARVPEFADYRAPDSPPRRTSERARGQVFISYSHEDRVWLDKLQTMLKPLMRAKELDVWADSRIAPGMQWRQEIERALSRAGVAVLMVSKDFLASDFVAQHELPPLLEAAKSEGLTVLWLCLSDCLHAETPIAAYQPTHDYRRPLDSLSPSECNTTLVAICREIKKAVEAEH